MTSKKLVSLLMAALATFLTAGCGDDGGGGSSDAMIRVIHLSADAPNVDVFVNQGEPAAFSDVAFEEGTDYAALPAGPYDFDVSVTGGTPADAVLSIMDLELEEGMNYTAVAFDNVANIQALPLVDDQDDIAAGNIRLRAVHAAAGVGQVDIWNVSDPSNPAPLWPDLDFGAAGDALDVPAAPYAIGIDTDNDANPDLNFLVPALPEGTSANVFAVNDGGTVFILAQLDDSSVVRIDAAGDIGYLRVLHLSPDAPAVDVHLDEAATPAVSDLDFREGTGWLALPTGTYDVDVSPTGTGVAGAVISTTFSIVADEGATVIAHGTVADLTAMPVGPKPLTVAAAIEDFSSPGAGNIRVNDVFHAAPAFDTVNVRNETAGSEGILISDLDYAAFSPTPLTLPVASYDVGIDANQNGTSDVVFSIPQLPEGTIASLFASNDDMGGVALVAYLIDGTVVTLSPNP